MSDLTTLHAPGQGGKDPWLAVFLSKVLPGAGHIYGGAMARGLFFLSISIALFAIAALGLVGFLTTGEAHSARVLIVVSLSAVCFLFIVNLYVLFDAYKVAKRSLPEALPAPAVPGYRKPWLAAFLSSILPGIGQFYNRQVAKGLAFLAASLVLGAVEERSILLKLFSLIVYFFGVKDAFDSAEIRNGSTGRFLSQEKAVVVFILVMFGLQAIPFAPIIKANLLEAFKIPAGSMYPTLKIGDHILVGKWGSAVSSVQRGDMIVFPYPENPAKNFVKRVVGVGGDKIQIINGVLYLNEQPVPARKLDVQAEDVDPPLNFGGPPAIYEEQNGDAAYRVQYLRDRSAANGGPWLVPQDAVFVMGDNRDSSMDSRVWGPVKRSTIIGKAMKIYWSWDSLTVKVRWERIGEALAPLHRAGM